MSSQQISTFVLGPWGNAAQVALDELARFVHQVGGRQHGMFAQVVALSAWGMPRGTSRLDCPHDFF